jgi:hypothetical protein
VCACVLTGRANRVAIKLVAMERSKVIELKKRLELEMEDTKKDAEQAAAEVSGNRRSFSCPHVFPRTQAELKHLRQVVEEQRQQMDALRKEAKKLEKHFGHKLIEAEKQKHEQLDELRAKIRELMERKEEGSLSSSSAGAASSEGTGQKKQQNRLSLEEKLRRAVIAELVKTERDYLDDLQMLKAVIFEPLRALDSSLVRGDEITTMVAGSAKLLEALQKDGPFGENVPTIVGDFMDQCLTAYSDYCSGSFSALTKAVLKNSKPFANFRKKVESDPRLKNLPLEAQFIKPVQRVCRYPLLLGELRKRTPNYFPGYEKLETVIARAQEAVTTINEIRRESEMMNRAMELKQRWEVDGLDDEFEFFGKTRRLLREETGAEVSYSHKDDPVKTTTDATCWMFTDCLVFCSIRRKKRHALKLIGVCQLTPGMTVREFPYNPEKGLVNFLEYSDHASCAFVMKFPTEAMMKEWKSAIEALVSVQVGSLSRQRQRMQDTRSRLSLTESSTAALRVIGPRGATPASGASGASGTSSSSFSGTNDLSPRSNVSSTPPPMSSPRHHLSNSVTSVNPPRPQFMMMQHAEEGDTSGANTPDVQSRVSGFLEFTNDDKELAEFFNFKN